MIQLALSLLSIFVVHLTYSCLKINPEESEISKVSIWKNEADKPEI